MRKKCPAKLLLLLLLLLLATGNSSAEDKGAIVLFPFSADGLDNESAIEMEAIIRKGLAEYSTIIEWSKCKDGDCLKRASKKFKSDITATALIKKKLSGYSLFLEIRDRFDIKPIFFSSWSCHVFDDRQATDALKAIVYDGGKTLKRFFNPEKENIKVEESDDTEEMPIIIDSIPNGASIYINENLLGRTPFNGRVKVEPGPAVITLKKKLYMDKVLKTVFKDEDDNFRTLELLLELVPNFGELVVASSVKNVLVTVRDWNCSVTSKGATPFNKRIPKGRYMVAVSKNGYSTAYIPQVITAGTTFEILPQKATLKKLRGKVTISSIPFRKGAKIFIDGRHVGEVPFAEEVGIGKRLIEIVSDSMKGAKSVNINDKEEKKIDVPLNNILPKMVMLEGGCYEMGDFQDMKEGDEKPVHEVCLSPFAIDKFEVTTLSYTKVMGKSRSAFEDCPYCPVENVTWDEADSYCNKVGKRLPTEAEWEYAAREAGKEIITATEKKIMGDEDANFNASSRHKKEYSSSGKFRNQTLPVGSFAPNSLGIYDMSGNVWEWVSDWYNLKYYDKSPVYNVTGPGTGDLKVLRGGSWYNHPDLLRTTNRYALYPEIRNNRIGFRCAD